ncbi:DUF6261 family protein [Streptococcus sp. HF-1907]|uniref:DUF6261 family protein n=1 Tax=Streptococcus sp. HF-1907 TaxID=2785793 RepID=UPI002B4BCBAD|nr:DUF6261 family protein [Streptococcus sp. HF-1907]
MRRKRKAYTLLKPLFDAYRNTARANYESETAEINHLLKQTEDETISSAIESLGLTRFIKRLKASQETFVKLYNECSTVKTKQTVYDQKTIRKELMAIYQDLIELVGIYQRRKTSTDYRPLIKVINNSRKTYADLIARRKGVAKEASTATAVKDA